MSAFPRDKHARLLKLLTRELELFEKVRALTQEQSEFLAADEKEELGPLNESLQRRQEVIDQIDGLHQETDPLMQSYVSCQKSAGGKKLGDIESAAGKLRGVMAECAKLNDSNIAAAKEMTSEYSRQIDKLSTGRKSIGLYVQGVTNDPEHFDKMS